MATKNGMRGCYWCSGSLLLGVLVFASCGERDAVMGRERNLRLRE